MSVEISFDVFKHGISLAIGRVFGSEFANDPEMRAVSDAASEVILTIPSFSGIRDRITEVKNYLTGDVINNLNAFSEAFRNFRVR